MRARTERIAERVLESRESTALDVLDRLLEMGVMATGDLTLGVAGVDLVYVRLSALLCASDRVLPQSRSTWHRTSGADVRTANTLRHTPARRADSLRQTTARRAKALRHK
jgi:gas vesicle structural protein